MIKLVQTAFDSTYVFLIILENSVTDIGGFLTKASSEIIRFLESTFVRYPSFSFKTYLELECYYFHLVTEDEMAKSHMSKTYNLMNQIDVEDVYRNMMRDILHEETEFFTHRSQWVLKDCNKAFL